MRNDPRSNYRQQLEKSLADGNIAGFTSAVNAIVAGLPADKQDMARASIALDYGGPEQLIKNALRRAINTKVHDESDQHADLEKLVIFGLYILSGIWLSLPPEQRQKIPSNVQSLADALLDTDVLDRTHAKDRLDRDGLAVITRIFEREKKIAEVVDMYEQDGESMIREAYDETK